MPSIQNRDPRFQIKTPPPSRQASASTAPPAAPAPTPISAEAETLLQQARQRSQVKISGPTSDTPPTPLPAPETGDPVDSPPTLRNVRRLNPSGLASSLSVRSRFVRLDVQALKQRLSESLQQSPGFDQLQRIFSQTAPLISQMRSSTAPAAPPAPPPVPPAAPGPEGSDVQPPAPEDPAPTPPAPPPLTVAPAAPAAELPQVMQALQGLSSLKPDQAPKTFNSLEAALEFANSKNSGAELIVAVKGPDGQDQYAVIPLKPGQKPDAVAAALQASAPAKAYLTDGDGWLQPLKPAEENNSSRFARVQELSQTALNDNARGLDRNRAGTWDRNRGQAYQENLLTVHAEVLQTQQALQDEKAGLESELKALKTSGQGDGPAAAALRTRLNTLGQQLQTLSTTRSILEARLSQQSVSNRGIPDTDMVIGQDRNRPDRIQERLQQALNMVESRMMIATPEELPALEAQREQLVNEMRDVSKRQMEALAAEMSYRMRAGALATMGKGLDDTRKSLEGKIQKLEKLEARMGSLKGDELRAVQQEVSTLRLQINMDRKHLIGLLKSEVKVFEANANMKERGAKAAVDLLNLQIKKLEALGDLDPRRTLDAVRETQSQLIATVEEAGEKFAGIRPSEAKALVGVSQQTDAYIKDYQKAQTQLKGLQEDIHRKTDLLKNRPMSGVGLDQLTAMNDLYLAKIQAKLKNAPEGSDLEKLKKLYIALEMKKNPDIDEDLRNRIDEGKIMAEIEALSQKPEVQKAFEEARQEAVKETFGKHDAAGDMARHILSPEFQEYLSLLPEEEQAVVLQGELGRLHLVSPAKAAEVQQALVGRQLESKSITILSKTSLEERKDAFAQVFALINDPMNAGDKSAKAADGLAKAIEKLSPEEMAKLESLMREQSRNPKAAEKIYQLLASKLPANSPALESLGRIHASGKLGGFMTLVAAVATTGKVPDAIAKGDFKSIADLTSSAFSVAGGAKGVADMFGFSKAVEAAQNLPLEAGMKEINAAARLSKASKALKALEVLGPVGDLLTVGLDGYGSYKDFSSGDYVGGGAKLVSAGAAGVGAYVAGSMLIAGSTGPGAPLVLAGATVVGLIAWGVDAAFGESDEETFLRQLGVLGPAKKPQPSPAAVESGRRMYENDRAFRGPKY